MSPRLWVDVGDLLAWQGTRTGIPRVVSNLVKRYVGRPDVGFFVFSDRSGSFTQVDALVAAEAAERRRSTTQTRSHRIGAYARRRAGTALLYLRQRMPPPAKRVLRRLGELGYDLWLALKRRARLGQGRLAPASVLGIRRLSALGARRTVAFLPDDRIVVLGAGWASSSLQKALDEQKRSAGVRVYQLVYDLTPVLLPQCFGPGFSEVFTRYFFEAAAVSDGLIAISRNSRADAISFCEDLLIKPPPIEVVRLGDEVTEDVGQFERLEFLEGSDFILSVGTVESRKNHLLLYQAWKRARESGVMLPDLVIVGRMGWAAADAVYAMKNDPTVRASIHLLNEVSDAQLEWLYANCLLTIYPSLYEGWGLPIAESLARGKVCLASSSSAMPEVAGDLVDYFSPYDAGECLRLVERYLDPAVLAARVRQIREQYPVTRWDDTVRQLEAALHRLSQ